jgi:hypothetical protein
VTRRYEISSETRGGFHASFGRAEALHPVFLCHSERSEESRLFLTSPFGRGNLEIRK